MLGAQVGETGGIHYHGEISGIFGNNLLIVGTGKFLTHFRGGAPSNKYLTCNYNKEIAAEVVLKGIETHLGFRSV